MYRPLSGKISAKATISYDVPKEEFDQFVNYVYDVYEEEGYNKSQVRVAVKKYLKDLEGEFTWGGGDSLDRERVYEYLKNPNQKGIVNPFLAKGGLMARGGKTYNQLLEDFNVDDLDDFESMRFEQMTKSGIPKAIAIELLINEVEGDYSQLSPSLVRVAKKQNKMMADGGWVSYSGTLFNPKDVRYHKTKEEAEKRAESMSGERGVISKELFEIQSKYAADGGMMARGGKTKSRYNEGLSWHQDHARFNKSEKYEKPLKRRRKY